MDVAAFAAEFWQKKFYLRVGTFEPYADLMSWQMLSSLLEEHRFVPPRIRLYKDGKRIPPDSFQYRHPAFLLKSREVLDQISSGATLIIDSVEQTNPNLRLFAHEVQSCLCAPVNVNLYAACGDTNGFPVHRDQQENFILQIAGEKHWRVWTNEPREANDLGQTPPYWEGTLKEGDLAYIPKNWWHVATPIGEPSLHLTLSLVPLTFADFFDWLHQQLSFRPELSRPLLVALDSEADHQSALEFSSLLKGYCELERIHEYLSSQPWNQPNYPKVVFPFLTE